jgi:hypothetical protein
MLTPRRLVITVIAVALAALVLASSLDTLSKGTALVALVIAEVLALRRR